MAGGGDQQRGFHQFDRCEANLSGSATATLTLTGVTPANTADYLVIVTNVLGAVTSSVALLTVTQAPPNIVTQPVSHTLYIGQTAQLTVGATGTQPLFYQWQAGRPTAGFTPI